MFRPPSGDFCLSVPITPDSSFDLVSYGAGLPNMSLRVFALVTSVGLIPPTLALTYSGISFSGGTCLTVILGLAMVALLLLIPKLALQYPDSSLVKLLLGGALVATHASTPHQQGIATAESLPRCNSCNGPMEWHQGFSGDCGKRLGRNSAG